MRDAFFDIKFLNARGILAQKVSDAINGGRSQKPSILCQLITGESQRTGISCCKES